MAQPIEKTSPPAFDIKSPLDISKWNAAGDEVSAIKDAKQQALDAQEKLVQSLEARYANPNYFKVAAGFLKPQLGGFSASLGSASEAMGENVEAQRAIAPTIERMRAEVAQGRIGMETNKEQARAIKAYDQDPVKDINRLREIYSLAPLSEVGASIAKRPEFEGARRAETGFGVDLQQKVLASPSLVIDDPVYRGLNATPEQAAQYLKKVEAGRPDGFSPQEWSTMTVPAKEDAIAQYASAKAKQGMSEGSKFALDAGSAHDILDELAPMRQLAMDPKLEPIFSLFKDGDLFSQIRAAVTENPGRASGIIEGIVAAKMSQLKNVDPATRAKADKLLKDIGALEVRLRGSLNNPTDAATLLNAQRSPTLANSRDGFVGILDQLALTANRDIGTAKLHNKLLKEGMTAKDAAYAEALENYRNDTRRLRREMAKSTYDLKQTPSWYDTRNQNIKPPEAAAETSTRAAPAASPPAAAAPAAAPAALTPAAAAPAGAPPAVVGQSKPAGPPPITRAAIAAELERRRAARAAQQP
tara:strand:- start:11972 stop:13558 length:1587 start_codon:yes stop_codon:yes gene_type:complete